MEVMDRDMDFGTPFDQLELGSFSMFTMSAEIPDQLSDIGVPAPPSTRTTCPQLDDHLVQTRHDHLDNLSFDSNKHPGAKQHTCVFPGCTYRGHSKRDVDRHHTARHENGPEKSKFFCPQPGCARSRKGWPRKDLRDRHVKTVHSKVTGDKSSSVPKRQPPSHMTDNNDFDADEVVLEGPFTRSRDDLLAELEREVSRRLVVEAQLDELRDKFEKMRSKVMIAVAVAE